MSIKQLIFLPVVIILLAALGTANAATIVNLIATIDGAQANAGAGTGSPGTGSATMTLDLDTNLFSWNVAWQDLSGAATVAHFHGPALPNANAGVQVSISTTSPAISSATLTSQQSADLLAGLWYINIHTTLNPGGEIRGQVLMDTDGDGDPDVTDPDDDNDFIRDELDTQPLVANNNCTTNDGNNATLVSAQVMEEETCASSESVDVNGDNGALNTVVFGPNGDLRLISKKVTFKDVEVGGRMEVINADPCEGCNFRIGYSEDEVPGALYAAFVSELPLILGGNVFNFEANNTATVILSNGTSDATWLVNAAGEIVVDLTNPPVTESFPFCEGGVAPQCRALISTTQITLIRIADGVMSDKVFLLSQTTTTYPDDPLPDEVVDATPSEDNTFLTFREDGFVPVEESDVSGIRIATYYFRQGNDPVGLNDELFGADFLNFDANGTGSTERRAFAFDWSVNVDGSLNVDFTNGDTNRYVFYQENSEIAKGIVIGSISGADTRVTGVTRIAFDGVTEFTNANLENRRYRALSPILDPESGPDLDYLFLPGGTGCRRIFSSSQNLTWSSLTQKFMDSFLFPSSSPGEASQRRSWEAITVTSGIQGDRYWVIENADFNDFTPGYVFSDPLTTPGRINSYEFIEDLTNAVDPCL